MITMVSFFVVSHTLKTLLTISEFVHLLLGTDMVTYSLSWPVFVVPLSNFLNILHSAANFMIFNYKDCR